MGAGGAGSAGGSGRSDGSGGVGGLGGAGERRDAVWRSTVTSPVLVVSAVVLAAAAAAVLVYWLVVGSDVDLLVILLALAFTAGACAACARVRVVVGPAGVAVESALFGFALAQHALDDISDARVKQVSLGSWVGWGYRVTADGSAVVLRGGRGLVLDLVSGKTFTVTLPDAAAALAALEAAADAGRG